MVEAGPTDELRFINAIIGFCTRTHGTWPEPLVTLGYQAFAVERELRTIMDGKDRTVVADLMCASDELRHVICVEVKSATLDEDQARRYLALTASNLLDSGGLPPSLDARRLRHDVTYVTGSQQALGISRQLAERQLQLPVIAGDALHFNLHSGELREARLNQVFRDGVAVGDYQWPHHFVPFMSTSPDRDIVPVLTNTLSGYIIRHQDFSVDDLAIASIAHWPLCGTGERRRFRDRLATLAQLAMREELSDYYERPGKEQKWVIKGNRFITPQQFQRLSRLATAFVERVQKGAPFRPEQLSFDHTFFDAIAPVELIDDVEDE